MALKSFLYGEAYVSISGFMLTNDNNGEAINLQRNWFENNKNTAKAHMDTLLKLSKVQNDKVVGLRKCYDNVELHLLIWQYLE